MTTLDELRAAWQEHDRKIEGSLRLNRELLRTAKLESVRTPLRRLSTRISAEIGVALILIICLGGFLGAHLAEPRFLWPAAILDAWLISCLATSIRQLVAVRGIDYAQPVTTIQGELSRVRMLRIRSVRWQLLTGQIVWWIPFVIVSFKALFGMDVYQIFSTAFLASNLLLGIAVIPIAIWAAKRFGSRLNGSPFWRWLMDEIAGRNLLDAQRYAETLVEFGD
jgi:hypothetical protein